MKVLLVESYLQFHKHLKPKYQVQINQLHEMHQIQNIINLIKINGYQIFLVNLKQVHRFVDHEIILNPNKPNAK